MALHIKLFHFTLRTVTLSLVLCAILLRSLPSATTPDTLWTKTFGGDSSDAGYQVEQTSDGGFIIVGETKSFGAGNADVYLIRTNSNGDTVWTKTYGGKFYDRGSSVQQTNDGGFIIAGETSSSGAGKADAYLIKINAHGDTVWTKTYGGADIDIGYSVRQTKDGGYILAGGTRSFGAGLYDIYFIRTNSTGDTLWTKTYGGSGGDMSYAVHQTNDSGYIIAGETELASTGDIDAYLIRTDSNGDTIWTKRYGVTGYDVAYSVHQTEDNGFIIAGLAYFLTSSVNDVYLIHIDANGDTLLTKTYGGYGMDEGYSIDRTSDSSYIIAGMTESFAVGYSDVYLIHITTNGDTLWTKTYGGFDYDHGYSVQHTSDNGFIVAGATQSFGTVNRDVYLLRLAYVTPVKEIKTTGVPSTVDYSISCGHGTGLISIDYSIPNTSPVKVEFYDIKGNLIKVIVDNTIQKGNQRVTWDTRMDNNSLAAGGVYIVSLSVSGSTYSKKVTLLR